MKSLVETLLCLLVNFERHHHKLLEAEIAFFVLRIFYRVAESLRPEFCHSEVHQNLASLVVFELEEELVEVVRHCQSAAETKDSEVQLAAMVVVVAAAAAKEEAVDENQKE